MKIGSTFSANRPSVATIGFFDGVHRGHQYLIEQVRAVAAGRGWASAVVTFPVHPCRVMRPDVCPALLNTCDEKLAMLEKTGVDHCVLLEFTPQLAALSAYEFMKLLNERYQIRALVIGYDHRFGHNRSEGFDDYVRYGARLGMEIFPAKAYYGIDEAVAVSSSRIRKLLLSGRVAEAQVCLGYEYFLQGTVVGGYRVGRTLGFPTANLQVTCPDKLVPADGVYAVWVHLNDTCYGGMLSIGLRPTLDNGTHRSIEVHIFDFHQDIYQHPLRLSFVRRTRDEKKFNSLEELITQLHRDETEIRQILGC